MEVQAESAAEVLKSKHKGPIPAGKFSDILRNAALDLGYTNEDQIAEMKTAIAKALIGRRERRSA